MCKYFLKTFRPNPSFLRFHFGESSRRSGRTVHNVVLKVNDKTTTGTGFSKKEAKQNATSAMFKKILPKNRKMTLPLLQTKLFFLCHRAGIETPKYAMKTEIVGAYYEVRATLGNIDTIGAGTTPSEASFAAMKFMHLKLEAYGDNLKAMVKGPPPSYESTFVKDYNFIKVLGSGGFGIVMEAEKKVMNKKRAVKRVRLPVDVEERQNIFRGELNCFAQLEHKNIVRFYHSWIELPPIGWQEEQDRKRGIEDETQSIQFDDDSSSPNRSIDMLPLYLYIEMELCQKETLRHWLDSDEQLYKVRDPDTAYGYFYQLLEAVEYIHGQSPKIIHRDLKPANIFFSMNDKNVLKIGDFGLATVHKARQQTIATRLKSPEMLQSHTMEIGTSFYMAPELEDTRKYTHKVDIFSLGQILIELFVPMETKRDRMEILNESKNGNVPRFTLRDTAKEMLNHDPLQRPEASTTRLSIMYSQLKEINQNATLKD